MIRLFTQPVSAVLKSGALALLLAGAVIAAPSSAMARGGDGHPGGGHYGGGHYGGGHYYGRSGGVHVGIGLGGWGWGAPYWGSSYGYWDWPYAFDAFPPVYAYPESPTVVVPAQPGPAPAASWYYCDSPEGYYPYVQSCSSAWRQVPATPPSASPAG